MAVYVDLSNNFKTSSNIKEDLKNRLGMDAVRSDSMINVISNSVGQEISQLANDVKTAYEANNYLTATGSNLDNIAYNLFGMKRILPTYANARESDSNISLYLSPYSNFTSFQAANGNNPIVIPKGTILTDSIADNGTLGSVQYITNEQYTLTVENRRYISATAATFGSSQNINRNIIKNINFKNYKESFTNILLATNIHPIINGRNVESDEEFRRRIKLFLTSRYKNNYADLTLDSLSVPGIIETEIIQGYYGVGTTGVIVFGPNRLATDKEVNDLQNKINSKGLTLNKIIVSKGFFVMLDLEIKMISRIPLSDVDKASFVKELKNIVNSYFVTNYNIKTISLDSIQQEILSLFGNKRGIEIVYKNGTSIFSKKYIRKTNSLNGVNNVGVSVPSNTITLQNDERLLINNIDINFEYIPYGA